MQFSTDITQESFITAMTTQLHKNPTDEQIDFFKDFRQPMICFASPGTGKTTSAILGLLNAECYQHIPGDNIYALSFTRMATAELATRHKESCLKLGISQFVHFQTLHSLCSTILKENFHRFGMNSLTTGESRSVRQCCEILRGCCDNNNIKADDFKLRKAVLAIRSLNNSMIFDDSRVKNSMSFKDTKMSLEDFTTLRKYMFIYNFMTEHIPVDDILLYTLLLMTRCPDVSRECKAKIKIMLVDEAQDLSLLQLRIISMLTDTPVLIGDMKQQIYGFNGACSEIVDWFRKLYPTARETALTQSFRCHNEIADYATQLIKPNKLDAESFSGIGNGGNVFIESDVDLNQIAQALHDEYVANSNKFSRDIMFLFRNNASSIPVAEALYHAGIPFRINKYKAAYEIDVVKDIMAVLNLCKYPSTLDYIGALRYVIPEFNAYHNLAQNPIYMRCKKTRCSVFEVNYEFKDAGSAATMMLLNEISENIDNGMFMTDLFNMVWPVYLRNYLSSREWMLEYPKEYYIRIISPLLRGKTYDKFVYDESEKRKIVDESLRYNRGVRCYTMHASKGLEADDVYILDCDAGVIPNDSQIARMSKADCDLEAALSIRNERALCYVACTRAKDNLHICYSTSLAPMMTGENVYSQYDSMYEYYKTSTNDMDAFARFTEGVGDGT